MNNEEKILAMLERMDARLTNLESGQDELKKDVSYMLKTQDKHTDLLLKAVNAIASMDSVYSDKVFAK